MVTKVIAMTNVVMMFRTRMSENFKKFISVADVNYSQYNFESEYINENIMMQISVDMISIHIARTA